MLVSRYYSDELAELAREEISSHRGWYIFEGLLFILIGFLAFSMPGLTALTIEFLLAALLFVGGVIRIGYALFHRNNRWWRLFSGAIYAIAGAMIFAWPVTGLTALLAVVGVLLLIEGVFDIGIAIAMRPMKNWGWILAAGIASIFLGVLIFAGFPATGIIYLAVAFGISFIFYGVSILAVALKTEKTLISK